MIAAARAAVALDVETATPRLGLLVDVVLLFACNVLAT